LTLAPLSLTPYHPLSASVLSLSPFRLVSSRYRSSEERNKPKTAEREICVVVRRQYRRPTFYFAPRGTSHVTMAFKTISKLFP
jgi:hypothetical protein